MRLFSFGVFLGMVYYIELLLMQLFHMRFTPIQMLNRLFYRTGLFMFTYGSFEMLLSKLSNHLTTLCGQKSVFPYLKYFTNILKRASRLSYFHKKASNLSFHPLPDHITHILLNRPLHRTSSKSLGDSLSDEHLDGFLIHR